MIDINAINLFLIVILCTKKIRINLTGLLVTYHPPGHTKLTAHMRVSVLQSRSPTVKHEYSCAASQLVKIRMLPCWLQIKKWQSPGYVLSNRNM